MTITEFLEARIAEDEISATMRECHRGGCDSTPNEAGYSYPCGCGLPERMMAECAAKRAILAECRPGTLDDLDSGEDDQPAPMWVARALASVYKDHPDYQQEWAA